MEAVQAEVQNSITFLNMTGDITITWDDQNAERMKALIRKKMDEGYTFFTTTKIPLVNMEYKRKVSLNGKKTGVDVIDKLIITDKELERLMRIDDKDVEELIANGDANLAKRKDRQKQIDTVKREDDPEKLAKGQSVGVRKLSGG